MKRPPQTCLRRKPAYRRAKSTPRLDLAATLVAPPFTWALLTQIPGAPATQPSAALTPVTLTVGDPTVIQLDVTAFFAGAAQFIAEHPVLCTTIAAGVIFAIWACNKPVRPAYANWG
jgi:hypothetical protein